MDQEQSRFRLNTLLGLTSRPTAVLVLLISGCANQQQTRLQLDQGYNALATGHYDQAIIAADEVLHSKPSGPGVAEAHYLRGRAMEDRAMQNPSQMTEGLNIASIEYEATLASTPLPTVVEANAHAGIANIAYYQDDYMTALTEWHRSLDQLPKEQDKVQALYRMGQCSLRLGRWDDADKYFALVEQRAPGQPVALAARQRIGIRSFFVQVATVATARDAGALIVQLRTQGVSATLAADPGNPNLLIVRTGPLGSYREARSVRTRLATRYANAIVVP